MDRITAPFTPDQVIGLWNYQFVRGKWRDMGGGHPFTCGNRDKHPDFDPDKGILIPTTRGWVCMFCDYTQNWAHKFMSEH